MNALNATIEQYSAKEESLRSEIGSDLISQLTVEEQATIDRLNDTIEKITQELKEIIQKRVEVSCLNLINENDSIVGVFLSNSLKEQKLDLNIKFQIIIEKIVIESIR